MESDDRYERRLAEETARLRVEGAGAETRLVDRIGQVEAALRQDLGGLRQEMSSLEIRLVDRIAQSETGLRKEMGHLEVRLVDRIAQSETGLRKEIGHLEVRMEHGFGSLRSDVIKWSFAFWIGQVIAMTAIMGALLR